jgi:hypothetical protein
MPKKDTLLVVHINHGHTIGIPLHKALMSHLFTTIIYYAPGVEAAKCSVPITRLLYCISGDKLGYVAYESMVHAINNFPKFNGYLFLHDDAAVREKQLDKITSSNVSMMPPQEPGTKDWSPKIIATDTYAPQWYWFKTLFPGYARLAASKEWSEFYPLFKQRCTGYLIGQADEFFIAASQKDKFVKLATWMRSYDIFLESAVPTLIWCGMEAAPMNLHTDWTGTRGSAAMVDAACINKADVVHPVKLSNPHNVILFSKFLTC